MTGDSPAEGRPRKVMVSKTDKTRPYRVAMQDPLNQRFRYVGNMAYPQDGTSEHFWHKLTSCHRSSCCGKDSPWRVKMTRKRRYHWKKELRNGFYE